MFDLLIRGGTVVDGTAAPAVITDVGVRDGRIAAIGDLHQHGASHVLEARGLVVAPGFIDVHSHSDFTLLADPRAVSSITQGVTTEIIGNCGHGCAPLGNPAVHTGNIYGYLPGFPLDWHTTSEYFSRLEEARPAVNVAALVPNGNLRLAVMGLESRPAAPDQMQRMIFLLEEGLEAGAIGYSTGLEYPTEQAASEREITALCRVTARRGGLYATHTRNRDVQAIESIEEAIRVAETAGVRLQISHLLPRRGGPPDVAERAIEAVERARDRGLDIAFDAHTRLHGITNLSAALPAWAFAGGPAALRERLRDPAAREAFRRHPSIIASFGLGGWDRVVLFSSARQPDLVGKSFAELAEIAGGDAYDAIFAILDAEADDPHGPLCLCHSYDEDDLLLNYRHPLCGIGSDATALAPDGPLAASRFPGAFTWAAWFLRRFVRERRSFTIEDAVHKLTGAAAERFGLSGRGRIAPGYWADLAVFEPERFGERGTLAEPNLVAEGMVHVVVNGVVTLEHGALTGQRGGQLLRRG